MKILDKLKSTFFKTFRFGMSTKKLTEFEEIKRNRLIKKMRSNAIAIVTNQIDIYSGCRKMNYLITETEQIYYIENINLKVFENFYSEFISYPIWEERNYYNKEYLAKLDVELNSINYKYKQLIFDKCNEIIEKFEYIKKVC